MDSVTSRIYFFVGTLVVAVVLEFFFASRTRKRFFSARLGSNVGMIVLSSGLIRLIAPLGAVTFAVLADTHQWGLFHVVHATIWMEIVVAIVVLDGLMYFQHRWMHTWALLWRMHRVHHSDPEMDFTTALRFHPMEMLFSLGIKGGMIVLLGLPVLGVLLFEIILSSMSILTHLNVRLSEPWRRFVEWGFVTPNMHEIHHQQTRQDHDTNYGFSLSIWDRLFRTYQDKKLAHSHIGLTSYTSSQAQRFLALLKQPFF